MVKIKDYLSEDEKTIRYDLTLKAKPVKTDSCEGCFFYTGIPECLNMYCGKNERKDGKQIIWVK